jgi:hypothetical protein
VRDVENILPSPCRIKKATEGGPLATDAHGTKCSLNDCLHQPHYTSPDPPPLVTSSTSAATTPRLLVSIARPAVVQIAATLATLLPALVFVCIALFLLSRTEELPRRPASSSAV